MISSLAAAIVAVGVLSGCGAGGDRGSDTGEPSAQVDAAYEVVPEPGRIIDVRPGEVVPASSLAGYRMAIVGDGSPSSVVLLDAARGLAAQMGAELIEVIAETPDEPGVSEAFEQALAEEADVVVGLGERTVDVFSFETAQWLEQQFLIVGAQLAEPTANVTAVIWDGATSRGSAASADGALDASALTPDLATAAMMTGIERVRAGATGVVLRLATG